jgi:hypothetical protein
MRDLAADPLPQGRAVCLLLLSRKVSDDDARRPVAALCAAVVELGIQPGEAGNKATSTPAMPRKKGCCRQ